MGAELSFSLLTNWRKRFMSMGERAHAMKHQHWADCPLSRSRAVLPSLGPASGKTESRE